MRRVVITGIGAVTPLGLTIDDTWDALLAGRSGIDTITKFDASQLNTRFAGELKGFDAKNYMDRKEARRLDPYIQYALAATEQAVTDSQIDFSKETPTDIGALIASGTGGVTSLVDNIMLTEKRGLRKVSPFLIPNMLVDSAAGKIAIVYNLRGPNFSVVNACASGTAATGEAFELIRRGDAQVMVTGGAEAALLPILLAGFDVMGAMSQRNDDPSAACRPFDTDRDGFVMSEGSAILVLELLEARAGPRRPHLCGDSRLRQQRRCVSHGRSPFQRPGR